jgi:FKBP-type peptidyl-prolyl cis-trans isomerase
MNKTLNSACTLAAASLTIGAFLVFGSLAFEAPARAEDAVKKPGATAGGGKMVTNPSGLKYEDTKVGTGAVATKGKHVTVHYTGKLADGKKFDSSKDRSEPFAFRLGAGEVIRGWDDGVEGMKIGGHRKLIIPPELGYGKRGVGGVIPPNSELHFDVELLGVSD